MNTRVENIYKKYIEHLTLEEKIDLLAITTKNLTPKKEKTLQSHSLLELEGLGAEIWKDIDTQEYVKKIRDEWDHRP
jgi:hypothetical protein